jgi:hypothetical protein
MAAVTAAEEEVRVVRVYTKSAEDGGGSAGGTPLWDRPLLASSGVRLIRGETGGGASVVGVDGAGGVAPGRGEGGDGERDAAAGADTNASAFDAAAYFAALHTRRDGRWGQAHIALDVSSSSRRILDPRFWRYMASYDVASGINIYQALKDGCC